MKRNSLDARLETHADWVEDAHRRKREAERRLRIVEGQLRELRRVAGPAVGVLNALAAQRSSLLTRIINESVDEAFRGLVGGGHLPQEPGPKIIKKADVAEQIERYVGPTRTSLAQALKAAAGQAKSA